ncbi:MAG TPA: DUF2177 family protein [Acholeplasmataceae bacterium]|jgi:uncharacterized membrane protein|nr:DUF2177 family protein [Acholeplasmataceae bacterium]HRX45275.1 DUF2177 family protein [Acholeplasmataceae bacterium]
MGQFFKLYGIAFVFFLVIDLIWLGLIAKNLYQRQIGHLMSDSVNWAAAIIFYLLFIVGLVYFAILPAVNDGEWLRALALGAFFGFITYATYDLTNLATLKDWPIQITLIDLAWGTFLGASISTLTYLTNNLLS